jgi:hypothetical protein
MILKTIQQSFLVFLFACLLRPALAAPSLIEQGDAAYAKREDIPQAKMAMVLYERAAAADSAHAVEGFWKASRAAWWVGENSTDHDAQMDSFQKAMDFARKAVALNSESVDAHFWLGATEGTYGKAKGVLKSLALVKPIRHEMAEVIRLNDRYLNGGAYRVLGVVDFKVPALMGGNLKRAKDELDKARSMGPSDPFVAYDYVQFYKATNKSQEAEASLQELTALHVPEEFLPEQRMLIRKAESLLGKSK